MVRRVVVRLPAEGVTSQRAAYGPTGAFTTQQHAQDPPKKVPGSSASCCLYLAETRGGSGTSKEQRISWRNMMQASGENRLF